MSIEKAIAIEIESGRPSGTATIITATAIVKYSKIVLRVSFDKRSYPENIILHTKKRVIARNVIKPKV